MQINPRLPKLS